MNTQPTDTMLTQANRWMQMHPEVISQYTGKVVAFDLTRGVLAAAPDIDRLVVVITHDAQSKAANDIFACDLRPTPSLTGHRYVTILHLMLSSFDVFGDAPAMPAAVAKVWELARLPAGWDGHAAPPPSGVACEFARQVIERAVAAGFEPSRVVADTEGGVVVYWFGAETLAGGSHRKVASVAIGNDGELAGLTEDRVAEAREGFDVALETVDATLTRLRNFVGA